MPGDEFAKCDFVAAFSVFAQQFGVGVIAHFIY
jgi:hypothetical protein